MGPNTTWMRRHERCTFEWIDGQGCGTKLRPSMDIALGPEHQFGFYDFQGMDHRFRSMKMIEAWLRHDCVVDGRIADGPNAAWMRTHQECTFEWVDKAPGAAPATKMRPVSSNEDLDDGRFVFKSLEGSHYSFRSMAYVDEYLRHGCKLARVLHVGDLLAAYDDATVGLPRPGYPICGVAVGRDGPHVVVACRGSNLSFVVADGLSVEGLPQIEKPERTGPTVAEIERAFTGIPFDRAAIEDATYRASNAAHISDALFGADIGEDIATIPAGTFSNLMSAPLAFTPESIGRAMDDMKRAMTNPPPAAPAPIAPWMRRWLYGVDPAIPDTDRNISVGYSIGNLTEAQIYAAQLEADRDRQEHGKAPTLFPEWSRAPRTQSQAIGAGLGVWGTRDPKPAPEAKPYPHVSDEDLLPDAGR